MQIKTISTFLSLADQKSYTKAAQFLFVSQSALSQQLQKMEQELGFALIDHSNKNQFRLTPAGQYFYENARQLVTSYGDIVKHCQLLASDKHDELRVGIEQVDARLLTIAALKQYAQKFPEIRLSIGYDMHKNLLKALMNRDYSLVFLPKPAYLPSGLVYREILKDGLIIVGVPEHPLLSRKELYPEDLKGQTLLMPGNDAYSDIIHIASLLARKYPSIHLGEYADIVVPLSPKIRNLQLTNAARVYMYERLRAVPFVCEEKISFGFVYHEDAPDYVLSFIKENIRQEENHKNSK